MKRYLSTVLAGTLFLAALPIASVQAAQGHSSSKATDWAPGVTVRSSEGSQVNVESLPEKTVANQISGRHHVRIDGHHKVVINTAGGKIVASGGEFLVDCQDTTKLHVFQGDAHLEGATTKAEVPFLAKGFSREAKPVQVALDGGDIRARNRDDDEFRKGTNRNKAINRIKPVKPPVAKPIVRPTPPPTTNVTPPPVVRPPVVSTPPPVINTPPPVVNTPLPAVGGGGQWWPWALGGLALGGGIFAIIDGQNDPASP